MEPLRVFIDIFVPSMNTHFVDPEFVLKELQTFEEFVQYRDLLNRAFMGTLAYPFFDDFPIWDPAQMVSGVHRFGILTDGQLQATASLRITRLRIPSHPEGVSIGLIGAVATDPSFQKRGLSRQLVDQLIDEARIRHVSLLLVWGSEHSFYAKLGFALCGEQWVFRGSDQKQVAGLKDCEILRGFRSEIFHLRKKSQRGLILNDEDLGWYEAHRNVHWYSLIRKKKITSYLGMGRGVDLSHIVHEWEGTSEEICHLLKKVYEDDSAVTLICPPGFLRDCFEKDASFTREFLALVKILRPKDLLPENSQLEIIWSDRNQKWNLTFRGSYTVQLDSQELSRMLLGDPLQTEMDPRLPFQPIPIWIWGLDSA